MIEQLRFIFFESFQSFKRYPVYSFISSLTIMICLIVISFIIYLSNVTNNISDNFKDNESILKIFINNSIGDAESNKICEDIRDKFNFQYATFENRNDLFKNVDKNLQSWLKDDLNFIPCLCSINIDLKTINKIDSIINSINETYGKKIEKTIYPRSYLNKFEKALSMGYSIIFIIGIIVFIISIFNISNIIKLNIESRKNIIEILQLHGAKKYFIKAPFIIEGVIHGFIGFLFSSLIIFLVFNSFSLDLYNHFLVNSLITTIPFKVYIILNLIFGILLGLIGSNLGTSNYLE
ncbi:MAG: hypothetical protein CMQ51_03565 [Gammaproteobacteria bacterium]|nr:hypothetical protein [Gammaproteobacteria bacterium]|tara:strand:- start:2430 stop:3308 length:879 start_codon:yes stop_codon:yes gene_type:complete